MKKGRKMNNITNIFKQLEAKLLNTADNLDATEILKEDHRTVEVLFQQFGEESGQSDKQKILEMIIHELTVHAAVEEDLVYPLIDSQDHEKINEALEEHHVVKFLLEELSHMKASDDKTQAKVKVLSEAVRHHIKEEEWELFAKLRDSGVDMQELGDKILKAKKAFKSETKMQMQGKAKPEAKQGKAKPGAKQSKAPAKKTDSKKADVKHAAKKPAVKKTAVKKAAVKKLVAQKSTAKKPASLVRKSTAKKSADKGKRGGLKKKAS